MKKAAVKSLKLAIRSELRSLGYISINIKNKNLKGFNVIADGYLRSIFLGVLVRLASDYSKEITLTPEEIQLIKSNASTINKEPWAAIMHVNEKGELIGSIRWKNLSKLPA